MNVELTQGPIFRRLIRFALPLMLGNLLQQLYNVADTLIVGRFVGSDALAAVGSAYTLMTFLTSVLLGLSMGSGAVFSIRYGEGDQEGLKAGIFHSFLLIGAVAAVMNFIVFLFIDPIMGLLQVPSDVYPLMREYLWIIFAGIPAVFLYNYFASLLRAVGNSVTPLIFLAVSALLNIGLDLLFVVGFQWSVAGAAFATVLSLFVAAAATQIYTMARFPELRLQRRHLRFRSSVMKEIANLSFLTCIQQSVMNFGILMVQGLVNSFGSVIMAAFAAAVKIDSFAYLPVQDFGNAFSTFVAQNYGARKPGRVFAGFRCAVLTSVLFSLGVSAVVFLFARPLMHIFVDPSETAIVAAGVEYLRVEGSFYWGIGILFLLYGFYRAVKKPMMSIVLTVISLGLRVALAYSLSSVPFLGVTGIWMSVPIGWAAADLTGLLCYLRCRKTLLPEENSRSSGTVS